MSGINRINDDPRGPGIYPPPGSISWWGDDPETPETPEEPEEPEEPEFEPAAVKIESKNTATAKAPPPINNTAPSKAQPVVLADMVTAFLARPPGLVWPWRELAKLNEIDIGGITTIIAGTSHGKTSVAISLALHFLSQGKKVLFWSGEMPPEILTAKMLGLEAEVGLKQLAVELRRRQAGEPVSAAVRQAIPIIERYCQNLYIPPAWEVGECCRLLAMADEIQPDVILVDYIQQLRPGITKYRTRDEEIEAVMGDLNLYAISKSVPIICFAQINREAKNTEKPNITCIRHSATIEQYSSNVIGVWNAGMARYKPTTPCRLPADGWYWYDDADSTGSAVAVAEAQGQNWIELMVLKSRYHGNVGQSVPLFFAGATGKIQDFPEHSFTGLGRAAQL